VTLASLVTQRISFSQIFYRYDGRGHRILMLQFFKSRPQTYAPFFENTRCRWPEAAAEQRNSKAIRADKSARVHSISPTESRRSRLPSDSASTATAIFPVRSTN